jgi:hypothetical protein
LIQNYVLIDFENIQPNNLEMLKCHNFKIIIFVGSNQKKISIEIVEMIQSFGNDAEYVRIEGNGQNALDFHIAYYIGKISALDNDAYFHIISKDTGFDPLINYLKTKKIKIQREKDIAEIPLIKISGLKTIDQKIDAIKTFLISRKNGKPTTEKTLANSLKSLFQKKLNDDEINVLIKEISKRKIISITGTKVSYIIPE